MEKYAISKIVCPSPVCVIKNHIYVCNICGKMNKRTDYSWIYAHFKGDCIISPYINNENNFSHYTGTRYDKLVTINSTCLICNGAVTSPAQKIHHAKKCIEGLKGSKLGFSPDKLPFNALDIPTPPGFDSKNARYCGYCDGKQYKCRSCPGYKSDKYIYRHCVDYKKNLMQRAFDAKLFEKTGITESFWSGRNDVPVTERLYFYYEVVYGCCVYCHKELERDSWKKHMRVCPEYEARYAEYKQE